MLDVPVEFDAKDFELDHPDVEKVKQIFQDLEFRRLTENFLKTFTSEDHGSYTNCSFVLPRSECTLGYIRKVNSSKGINFHEGREL